MEKEPEGPKDIEYKVVATKWGITDDTVELPNGKVYYFFKLPHKVRVEVSACTWFLASMLCLCDPCCLYDMCLYVSQWQLHNYSVNS